MPVTLVPASWTDEVSAIATAVAAIGTLAAVIVALYLNVWRERAARPRLALEDYEDTYFGVGWTPGEVDSGSVFGLPLIVRNANGRRTAHQAQVLVTLSSRQEVREGEEEWFDWIIDQPLIWKFASLPEPAEGTTSVDIPPGVARKLFVVFIGEPNQLYRTLSPREGMSGGFANEAGEEIEYTEGGRAIGASPPIGGVLATHPFTASEPFWIWRDTKVRLRFTLTSHDSDAVLYEATLSLRLSHPGENSEGRFFLAPEWSKLERVRG